VTTKNILFHATAWRPIKKGKISKKAERASSVTLSLGTAEGTWFIA
jgi:hypothetical protein